jgi:asparagine synthase (glutamine-hydrolysing)
VCGIAGVLSAKDETVALPLLRRMTDLLAHRGPDGEGHYVDGPVGLGHRRLAIIDLSSSGHQPMCNETGDVVLTYNGEIYNFQNLRTELEALSHRFHSRTDSEVVVHAYEQWGESCVERFNGMFAFAIWDRPRRRLFLARDRFGVKPLYYSWDGRQFVFASEIKAILAYPGVDKQLHLPALNQYFTFQNILTDETLFAGIRTLPAGTWMTVDAAAPEPKTHTYWDFDFTDPLSISREDAAEELNRLFTQAVTRQLVSDVPVGSYLSGGMDSGSITAVARRGLGRLSTFTCGFDLSSASGLELAYDERANAEVLSNLLKTEHYEVVLHAGDMEHVMPDLIWRLEDLRIGQCYPNYYVARLASRFVKVVLSGAGGDELVAGYPWRYYRSAVSDGQDAFFHSYYDFWQRLVSDEQKPALFKPDVWSQVSSQSTFDVFRRVVDCAPGVPRSGSREDFVNTSLYFELKTFLHGLLLVEDKISMAHSLETRVPFLDHDLVDFVQRLPVSFKLQNLDHLERSINENETAKLRRYEHQSGDGKMILREAMARVIPPEVTARVKQGFSAPDASWFRGESIDYINALLGDPRARIYEYLQPSYVAAMLDEHTCGQRNHRLFIWSALSFEWWLRRFLD